MNYIELIFTTLISADYQQDMLMHELAEYGFDTFEESELGFKAYIPSANFDEPALIAQLAYLREQFSFSYAVNLIPHKNWNAVWESNFEPVRIGHNVLIRATFHPHETGFAHEIIIDPKMAFGTGHHATTALMIRFMLESDLAGKTVLDMGAGTGILAILAAQMQAAKIVAIDHDPVCVASIFENSTRNGQEQIEALEGSKEAIPDLRFDLIIANINRNILLDQLPAYAAVMPPDAALFLSGFHAGDDAEILIAEAEKQGFSYVSMKTDQHWAALHFTRIK